MNDGKPSEGVARYWDENRAISLDPAYWMAHPLCRAAINRRISGSPHEWPLDWFRRVHAPTPFRRGVSWGCGLGAFERSAIRIGLVHEVDAFDISSVSLQDARREAEREGVRGIHYRVGDFNDPRLERGRYDIVFFHASLHHVDRLGRLFRRLGRALPAGAAVYVDEYVGPSAHEWDRESARLALPQKLLDACSWSVKTRHFVAPPVNIYDPSEAVRSGEIQLFLRDYLDIVEWRPFGGQIAGLVFPQLQAEWTQTDEGSAFVQRVMDLEDDQLLRDPDFTHHLVAYGKLKPKAHRPGLRVQAERSARRRFDVKKRGWIRLAKAARRFGRHFRGRS